MDRHIVEATLSTEGTVVLEGLPFEPGDAVKITVVKQVSDQEPFLSPDQPQDWKNANPAYWTRVAVERIVEKFQPEKIILFGSHAKGTATAHSEIDLLVVSKMITDKRSQSSAIRRMLSDFPIPKDIIVATEQEVEKYGQMIGTVLQPALQEGKVLYERH